MADGWQDPKKPRQENTISIVIYQIKVKMNRISFNSQNYLKIMSGTFSVSDHTIYSWEFNL